MDFISFGMIQQFFTRVSVEVEGLGGICAKNFPLGKGLSCLVFYATTLNPLEWIFEKKY